MYLAAFIPKDANGLLTSLNFNNYSQLLAPSGDLTYYREDVIDCLMRYALTKYPKRNFQNPVFDYKTSPYFEPIYSNFSYYPELGEFKPPKGDFFKDLINNILGNPTWTNMSLPVDLRATSTFIWEKSCFDPLPGGKGLWQSMPVDYLTPYWMARYLFII